MRTRIVHLPDISSETQVGIAIRVAPEFQSFNIVYHYNMPVVI